jgi:hypothetical protein
MKKWFERLQAVIKEDKKADVIPEGWFCCEDFAKEAGRSYTWAQRNVMALFKKGTLNRKRFSYLKNNGQFDYKAYYSFKK